jgi:hypothetical protein
MEIISSSAVIMIILQLVKDVIPENAKKFIPVVSIVIGVGMVWLFGDCVSLQDCIKHGIAIGL